jgi:hypothetical protein
MRNDAPTARSGVYDDALSQNSEVPVKVICFYRPQMWT